MVNKNVSSSREEEISLLFMDLNRLFGETYQGTTPLMSLHGPFEKQKNIIFSVSKLIFICQIFVIYNNII